MDDLKKHIKDWDIKTIIQHSRSNGMVFGFYKMSIEDLQKEEDIMTREIKRRIKEEK